MTREAAAHAAGISVATLRDAEKGRDSRGSTLAALAAVYGVSIDEFFAHGDDATPGGQTPGEKQSGPGPLTLTGVSGGTGAGIGD